MGSPDIRRGANGDEQRLFVKRLLSDVRALEQMLSTGLIESSVRRVGAEQELFLVDRSGRPAPCSEQILADLDDPGFTTELARFNLEFNLDPLTFGTDCLSRMEQMLDDGISNAAWVASHHDVAVLLTGILPTLTHSDLGLENMADNPRYMELNKALTRMRGRAYEFNIKGTDELTLSHDSVMPEACNTSFQVHFQVAPQDFANLYNTAQATIAPVLAAATNSPLLFGKRLWRETRIAVFQQALETRQSGHHERSARVSFGRRWVDESVLEIFKEDIARFRAVLATSSHEDPFELLQRGEAPQLKALSLHNGTVYRWNRACYGVADNKAHLRIENRVFPAGPTVRDEVANAAFWFGLLAGLSDAYGDIRQVMDFDHTKSNFLAAARLGLDAQLTWIKGKSVPTRDLICKELLPLAREALQKRKVLQEDIDCYLTVIEERVSSGQTGSQWMLDSLKNMRDSGTRFERLSSLTNALVRLQRQGQPVHQWPIAEFDHAGGWKQHYQRVEQVMTTDLFTVHEDDLIDLAAALMAWEDVRYVLVEDDNNRLVGLVSLRVLLDLVGQDLAQHRGEPIPISRVMRRDLCTVAPDTPTIDAIKIMRNNRFGCLPVVVDDRPVGIVTDRTFVHIVNQLLEKPLKE